mmetsp:Transcript_1025/g.1847  ORF Transcript_1025/g.1847 Transcript_1025/m.1847 type:complete len:222 (+) Transcript_1025:156-821(+)
MIQARGCLRTTKVGNGLVHGLRTPARHGHFRRQAGSAKVANRAASARVNTRFPANVTTTRRFRPQFRINSQTETTYVMVKPDGVQRGLVGEIISRFERKGYALKGLQMCVCDTEKAEEHYKELADKPFFSKLVDYICSGPVVCMLWEGTDVVKAGRKIIGATNPTDADCGTIRGDFGVEVGRNIVHGSDSVENGEREIKLWFGDAAIVEWEPTMTPWIKEF